MERQHNIEPPTLVRSLCLLVTHLMFGEKSLFSSGFDPSALEVLRVGD